jgi:hypothetical protein
MIKSLFFGMCLLVAFSSTVSAQHVNIGVKGGLNFYDINSNTGGNTDYKAGFNLGLLGHIHLTGNFGLQPEIYYSLQGAKSGNTNINLGYMNIPVLVQYMFNNGFRLQAGPQLGFLLSAKSKTSGANTDIKDNYKTIEVGLSFGGSYVHPPTGFGVDLRFNRGLTNISDINNVTATNQGIQLGVFYLFNHRS